MTKRVTHLVFSRRVGETALFKEKYDSSDDTVIVFPLRQEAEISGEKNAYLHLVKTLKKNGYKVLSLVSAETKTATFFSFFSLNRILQLRKLSRENRVKTVVLKIPTAAQIFAVPLLTLGFKGRVIVWVDGMCWQAPKWAILTRLLMTEPAETLLRMIINNTFWVRLAPLWKGDVVVATERQRQTIIKYAGSGMQLEVIPNSAPLSGPPQKLAPIENKKTISFGYIGHTYPVKGVEDILEALTILKNKGIRCDFHFAFSSRGPRKVVVQAAGDGHVVEGDVQVSEFFSKVDCLVFPYLAEWGTNVFPSVFLEASLFGVPVIVSDLEVFKEFYKGVTNTLYIEPGNAAHLAQTMQSVIEKKIQLASNAMIVENFTTRFPPSGFESKWRDQLDFARSGVVLNAGRNEENIL